MVTDPIAMTIFVSPRLATRVTDKEKPGDQVLGLPAWENKSVRVLVDAGRAVQIQDETVLGEAPKGVVSKTLAVLVDYHAGNKKKMGQLSSNRFGIAQCLHHPYDEDKLIFTVMMLLMMTMIVTSFR